MSKQKPILDEFWRAVAVMIAAGRSARVVDRVPEEYRKQLASLCDVHGCCVPAVRDKVITILRKVGQENKATIDGLTEEDE